MVSVVILLSVGLFYYLKTSSKLCILLIGQERRESCYMKSALRNGDFTICSNMKELYREKRCVDLVESNDTQLKEAVLNNL